MADRPRTWSGSIRRRRRIRNSPVYQIAQELHPGGANGWNGELYARTDAKWGGLANDGSIRLNQRLVLDQLTGGEPSADPQAQAQALATVLHESKHTRSPIDAENEPNAVRAGTSIALNEAFVEISTIDDFRDFADQAGYGGVPDPEPEYQGAVHAGNELLNRATNSATSAGNWSTPRWTSRPSWGGTSLPTASSATN